jgi:hypothetical protein
MERVQADCKRRITRLRRLQGRTALGYARLSAASASGLRIQRHRQFHRRPHNWLRTPAKAGTPYVWSPGFSRFEPAIIYDAAYNLPAGAALIADHCHGNAKRTSCAPTVHLMVNSNRFTISSAATGGVSGQIRGLGQKPVFVIPHNLQDGRRLPRRVRGKTLFAACSQRVCIKYQQENRLALEPSKCYLRCGYGVPQASLR